ncbi:proteobacterial dedicated sortase system histidine kinase [Opacimonas viscosa]|uniref:histidine kinase n=1 Tax=Opacimonas viscosa TaxID=2961944 RepID=A0AA41WZZ2_9ALTE|nr:proteobacterial dedicated sortase system histidine kinase [Opacimonas viscosa]
MRWPKRIRVGLQAKILVFSSFLFAIPYLGYQYVWELETYLRIGQEQTLVGTARSVATVMHERPSLFAKESAFLNDIEPGKDLYAPQINQPIRLDGALQDWSSYQAQFIEYDDTRLIEQSTQYIPESLAFTHMVGQYGRYLYAMFDVVDDVVINRNENMLSIHKNDFLQIAMRDEFGQFQRFIVAPYQSGWVNAYRLAPMDTSTSTERYRPEGLERRIQGFWQNTTHGYRIELRFPLAMMQGNIAFAISDVDNEVSRDIRYSMGTANPERVDELGTVIVPSPEIEQIIQGLDYANARVWIVDKHQRVLARTGDIQTVEQYTTLPSEDVDTWLDRLFTPIYEYALRPLYDALLTQPPQDYIDELESAVSLEGLALDKALQGQPATHWRLSPDNKAVILSAAHPVFIADDVMGAVVVEQTTHGIRTLRNQALEKQFTYFIGIMVIGTLALFGLASHISSRIRSLRNSTDKAIDKHGKITGTLQVQSSTDEIGDLSRSFAHMLSRLGQYNQYLENVASRLSHELRTPVAVVKSSLENLELVKDKNSEQAHVFVARAQDGLARLSHILQSMSEATRLEHIIERTEKQSFELIDFLENYLGSYTHQTLHDKSLKIQFDTQLSQRPINGSPELFAQMLDKILDNAVDFAHANTTITVSFNQKNHLTVKNIGDGIPHGMAEALFDSMVSIRGESENDTQLHLGLGLHIAKMIAQFHGFNIGISEMLCGQVSETGQAKSTFVSLTTSAQ